MRRPRPCWPRWMSRRRLVVGRLVFDRPRRQIVPCHSVKFDRVAMLFTGSPRPAVPHPVPHPALVAGLQGYGSARATHQCSPRTSRACAGHSIRQSSTPRHTVAYRVHRQDAGQEVLGAIFFFVRRSTSSNQQKDLLEHSRNRSVPTPLRACAACRLSPVAMDDLLARNPISS